ncbi:MAG TPA: sulfatase-like hydrolase/transferase [Verrucomicrobiota bacterium]|nr:sulfatase-like hydrolase/transferase [Verrucomicrobiota bacterium]
MKMDGSAPGFRDGCKFAGRWFGGMRWTGVLLLLAAGQCASGAPAERPKPPNILVIMSDEHNASVLGCYGNPIVRTPNLDRLAARGVVFENCYCNSPLCVPSRQSFTTGKYISRIGAWNNHCRAPADSPSLPRVLQAAGYETFLCGKMHYDAACRYGFTETGGNMNRSQMTGLGRRRPADELQSAPGYSDRFQDFRTGEASGPMKHDQAVTAGAREFLRQRQPGGKPFFLLVGYLAPHFPLIVPEPYWAQYRGKVPLPEIPEGFLAGLPLNYQHLRVGFHYENVPPELVRKGRELYYGLTEWMDAEVGKVLKALAASAAASNTVVIYTADHGENMGEHGLWWKNCVYDSAARVPLIVSWPERWPGGQRRAGVCSLVDVVQTIADLGGARTPADWNGNSLAPVLANGGAPWKDRAVSEYYAHHVASGYAMIRAGQYKYVYHAAPDARHPAQRELYDLQVDPGEFRNLALHPEQKARVEQLHAALVREIGEDPEVTEQRCRRDIAQGYGVATRGQKKRRAAE